MAQNHRIIIARHGNTFQPDEVPRRVGSRTDIPLVASGRDQAMRMGEYLRNYNLFPSRVIAANLVRTRETAKLACDIMYPELDDRFNEIDYGVDENKTEAEVLDRIGQPAMDLWNKKALPPAGWNVDSARLIQSWKDFADSILGREAENVLLVTSNGVARFAPFITDDYDLFAAQHPIKLATGALGILEHINNSWEVQGWNIRP